MNKKMNGFEEFEGVSGVYMIRNTENGKKYIGSSKDVKARIESHRRRLKNGSHFNNHLQNSWIKYGPNSFEFVLVKRSDKRLRDEQDLLDSYDEFDVWDKLYNFCLNVESPPKMEGEDNPMYGKTGKDSPMWGKSRSHSEETKKKISENRDYNSGKDHHMYGKDRPEFSDEWKRKMSELSSGENHHMYGKSHSEETKRKMSEAHKGKEYSEERCKAISERNKKKGKWQGEDNPSRKQGPWIKGKEMPEKFSKKVAESKSDLDPQQVKEIRKRYENEEVTYSELAEEYPVGTKGIGCIIRRDTWTHID